jgi:LmbE family N-acetylglucosaminyl deacetylase
MQDIRELLAKTKNKTLMVVYPHPDDETMAAGGLLIAAKKMGYKTIAVLLTKGAAGQIHIHPKGKSLKQLRETELKKAVKILGVDELVLGDFDDGKLRQQKWTKWVNGVLEKYQPGVVVTYDHSGLSGHPDHIALSVALKKLANKDMVLLWTTLSDDLAKRIVSPETQKYLVSPDYKLDLGFDWVKKWRAARAHASQALGNNFPIPLSVALAWQHYEWYHKVDLNKNYRYKFGNFDI